MSENDTGPMQLSDVTEALMLLTRLPVNAKANRGVAGAWAWPLAGAAVGAIGALIGLIAMAVGLGAGLAAAFALAGMIATTGALHEDGLADCCDGFWGGPTPDRRLDIMKDSRIGTYGVLALVVSGLMRWAALSALFAQGLVVGPLLAVAILSRAPMVAIMGLGRPARRNGLAGSMGQPDRDQISLAWVVAGICALISFGFSAIVLAICAAGAGYVVYRVAHSKVGGQTGDVLGASQQVAEIIMLSALVAILV